VSFGLFYEMLSLILGSWWEVEKERGPDPFPGLDMRKVDMTAYNSPRITLQRRQLQYYRLIGELPKSTDDPNIHAAAHLYASDRNGLFAVGRPHHSSR
jgi:hypothetical protein